MELNEQDKKYFEMKSKFLRGALTDYESKYARVVEGWEKSRKMGADAHRAVLTDEQRDMHVFERIDDLSKCHLAYFRDYYESRNNALKNLGGAIFYLDTELAAFHKDGNREFLDYLKSKGIRIGTKFSVENVGVFAGNAALNKPFSNCFSAGQSHFCDILCEFACIARYGEATGRGGFHAVNLILLPLEKCYKNSINSASFILEAGDFTYKNRIMYPHIESRFRLLEQSAQYSTDIMMLLDENGDIMFANSRFENEFGKPITEIINRPISEALPPLAFCDKALRAAKELPGQNVQIPDRHGNEKVYYAETQQINENKRRIGLKLTLKTSAQIRKYAASANAEAAIYRLSDIIGKCPAMQRLKQRARAAAGVTANVLITGESGTGKELFARSIHSASARADMAYIAVNCTTVQKTNAVEELVGRESEDGKCIFQGKLEQADGGTIFFDDISEMPPEMQNELLRFIDTGFITRIGGRMSTKLDVRIIAAANRDLRRCVENGSFKAALYYRLNIIRLELPPLRERGEDLTLLINHFVNTISEEYGKNIFPATEETVQLLKGYDWPGNLTELHSLIERFIISAPANEPLSIHALPSDLSAAESSPANRSVEARLAGESYSAAEEERLRELMLRCNGNKSAVAKLLHISRGTLYKKLRRYGLE